MTSGLAPSYIQANLIVLPSKYAADFRLLCLRNPVPCPILAESKFIGSSNELRSWLPGVSGSSIAADVDIRRDIPKYMVYRDGKAVMSKCADVVDHWTDDHVAFLIGCSYSFEAALARAGLTPPHVVHKCNVSMYRTTLPLCPAGVFIGSTYVVSMRLNERDQLDTVRDITRSYVATHGEPIAWGWDAVTKLGIKDIASPEWGDPPLTPSGELLSEGRDIGDDSLIPVFWGCGVTPQEAVRQAELPGVIMAHVSDDRYLFFPSWL